MQCCKRKTTTFSYKMTPAIYFPFHVVTHYDIEKSERIKKFSQDLTEKNTGMVHIYLMVLEINLKIGVNRDVSGPEPMCILLTNFIWEL